MLPTMTGVGKKIQRLVYFSGSTALRLGQAVCYDANRILDQDGTSAPDHTSCEDRYNVVELPSVSNNWWFAGVTDQAYPALSGGQWIVINEPGSVCQIAIAGTAALTIDSSRLSFLATGPSGYTGLYQRAGFPGRGSATVLQSVVLGAASASAATANSDSVTNDVPVKAAYGAAFTYTTGRITISGIESCAAEGDTVIVLSGARTTGANTVVTPYATTVSAVSTNYIELTTDPDLGADGFVSVCIYRGEPTVLAHLDADVRESGGIQYNTCTAAPVIAATQIACGMIYFDPSLTLAGDLTITPAAPVSRQAYWGVYLDAATGANDVLVAATNAVATISAGTAFSSGDLDAAGDFYYFQAVNGKWALMAAAIA